MEIELNPWGRKIDRQGREYLYRTIPKRAEEWEWYFNIKIP